MLRDRAKRKTSRGPQAQSINVRADIQVHYWTKELQVDQRTLTGAVKAVGPLVEKVREYLRTHTTVARHGDRN